LEDDLKGERFPGERQSNYSDDTNRRLQIKNINNVDDGEAIITVVIDYYSSGGLFGGGNTWSRERMLKVVQEEDEWKIDTHEFFY
jgi:hypothetical protein